MTGRRKILGLASALLITLAFASYVGALGRTQVMGLATKWTGDMAAKSTTAIHAAFAGNNGSNAFPGPITQPSQVRTLAVTFASSWDGGNVTIVGTDLNGASLSETFTAAAGTTVIGKKQYASVVSATKGAVGATSNTASIGTDVIRGMPLNVQDATLVGFQFKWPTTGSPIGVISFEGSNAYNPSTPEASATDWVPITADSTLLNQPNAIADTGFYSFPQWPFNWIRPVYTQTSGGAAAVLSAYATSKRY